MLCRNRSPDTRYSRPSVNSNRFSSSTESLYIIILLLRSGRGRRMLFFYISNGIRSAHKSRRFHARFRPSPGSDSAAESHQPPILWDFIVFSGSFCRRPLRCCLSDYKQILVYSCLPPPSTPVRLDYYYVTVANVPSLWLIGIQQK